MNEKATVVTLALTACLLAGPLPAQDWAGKGRAQGTILDPDGNPLEGAKVTMIPTDSDIGPEPVYSNEKGRWVIGGLRGGAWRVLIDLEGYKPAEGPYRVNPFGASQNLEITLAPNPFSSITSGDELLAAGDHAGARAEYEKAIPHLDAVGVARLRSRIGDTYMGEGDYAGARREYQAAIAELQPGEQAHVRLQMANSYQLEGDLERARAEYERLLPLLEGEGKAPVYLAIARTHGQEENLEAAIAALEKALEVAPDNVAAIQLIADLLTRTGRESEAQEYLDLLPEGTKLPPDMLLNIGIEAYNKGELEAALEYFNRTVEENPDLAEAYYYRGLVHLNQSANEDAIADFEKLLALGAEGSQAEEAKQFLAFLKPGG